VKIHLGDDTTTYKYRVSVTLMFEQPDCDIVYTGNGQKHVQSELEAAQEYIAGKYRAVLNTAGLNKRPKDLCGQSEIIEYWDLNKTDKSTYTVALDITGFGIEYDKSDLIRFFLNLFPAFQRVFTEQRYNESYDGKGMQLNAVITI
jgi:hypothetical protein